MKLLEARLVEMKLFETVVVWTSQGLVAVS